MIDKAKYDILMYKRRTVEKVKLNSKKNEKIYILHCMQHKIGMENSVKRRRNGFCFFVVDVMFPLSSILFGRMRGNGERLLESYSM